MGQLLLVVFIVAIVFVASLKTAALLLGGLLLATLVVQATASGVGRTRITMGEALRAIVLSTFFSFVAAVTAWSFRSGGGMDALMAGPDAADALFGGLAGLALTAFQFAAYFLGFRVALGLPYRHSALVAVASTAIMALCTWVATSMLA